jgi:calcium-dependent protein kinase
MGEPGQFGRAVQATYKKTGQVRACKIIGKARFARASPGDQKYHYDALRAEITVMAQLDHPNVIKLYDVFETDNDLYIIMELCAGGELFDRIKAVGNYSERDAAAVLRQVFNGIQYLHSKKIAHCDLKPDNFLFLVCYAVHLFLLCSCLRPNLIRNVGDIMSRHQLPTPH